MYFFYMYKIHVDRPEDAQAVLEILNAMIQCIKLKIFIWYCSYGIKMLLYEHSRWD